MKYIVETIGISRFVHVVEADDEEQALEIAKNADDNWQEYLGTVKVDINEYSEEQIKHFKDKQFFWNGIAKLKNGEITYDRPQS